MLKIRFSYLLSFLLFTFISFQNAVAQPMKATELINWSFEVKKVKDKENTYDIVAKTNIRDKKWHIYTLKPGGDGSQIPTELKLSKNADYKKIGGISAKGKTKGITEDEIGTYYIFDGDVTLTQRIEVSKNTTIKGEVYFQTCDDKMCLPPTDVPFSLKITDAVAKVDTTKGTDTAAAALTDTAEHSDTTLVNTDSALGAAVSVDKTNVDNTNTAKITAGGDLEKKSLWQLFIAGLIAGFIAFIMPCIYAMLPVTVSFFTKRSKDRATGIKNAIYYSLSIILIFALIGGLISLMFNEKTMYEISTSIWFNLFVFVLFIVFGISLLGAFEITLPASWSSKLDSKANTNSFWGIFMMALVLVVVSFSCTSAFISTLVVYIVNSGNKLGGIVGFIGFGLAIALPFALGALFPGMMNKVAKSGGWLNAVKVTMGFLELALALKFLSNVDLAYHWRLLDYEIYLALWIVIFGLLGLYLLGKLKLSHDEELPKNLFGVPYIGTVRLLLAIGVLSFTVYLIPGMWGAPLAGVSGFLPERKTLDFNIHDKLIEIQTGHSDDGVHPVKYADKLKSELPGVVAFFDYQEALDAGKKTGKPVLLDFTGHSCVNCRKMERDVLSKPQVLKELAHNFIVASLYTDDKTELAEADKYISKHDGSKVKTLGDLNLDIELTKYGNVAQPLYIFVDGDGNLIEDAGGYVNDIPRFVEIINRVKAKHAANAKK